MKTTLIVIAVLVLVIGGGVALATSGTKDNPGYVEFTMPELPELKQKVSIDIGPLGLKPLKWIASAAEEPEAQLFKKIDSVKVKVYDLDGDYLKVAEKLKVPFSALANQGWEQVLAVNEDHEKVLIYAQIVESNFTGICVLVVNDREAVFINATGKLAQEDLAQVMQLHNTL